jgi:hypothetical protein
MPTPEERIADAFNAYFARFDITIGPQDAVVGTRRALGGRGWRIRYRVDPDDAGLPSLEFYATHRMTSDTRVGIWADGHVDDLDAIWESYAYDAKTPGSEQAARAKYVEHNQAVASQLGERGLFPEGDINAFLRIGALDKDSADQEGFNSNTSKG